MKRLILIILFFGITTLAFAEDRVRVQVQFRQALWACPSGDEVTDLNVGTPSVYEHTCSDGTWLNSFKEYNGVLAYTPEDYDLKTKGDLDKEKKDRVDAWIYEIKNPPIYIEPTPEEIQSQINDKEAEIQNLQAQKTEAVAKLQPIEEVIK